MIEDCKKCKLSQNRLNIVWGKGNEHANVMFIGEGPGAEEDKTGLPFVGKAGKLLDMAFQAVGIDKDSVYIANVVKCRPPGNRNPEADEIEACSGYLKEQIQQINPKIIVLLGSVALKAFLGNQYKITESRGKWFEKDGRYIMPTFHPAALLRDEAKKIFLYQDLLKICDKLNEILKI